MANEPKIIGIDLGRQPAAVVVDTPYGRAASVMGAADLHAYRERVLRSFAEGMGMTYEQFVEAQGWNEPRRREAADRAGPKRLEPMGWKRPGLPWIDPAKERADG